MIGPAIAGPAATPMHMITKLILPTPSEVSKYSLAYELNQTLL